MYIEYIMLALAFAFVLLLFAAIVGVFFHHS